MRKKVRVQIIETGEVFDSINLCADYLGVCPQAVSNASLQKRHKSVKGYHIYRIDDPIEMIPDARTNKDKCRKIMCNETGEIFESLTECARHFGVCRQHLYSDITSGYKCHGFTFTRL